MNGVNLQIEILNGEYKPLGASHIDNGFNFAVFAPNAERIDICIFENEDEIAAISLPQKTNGVFHGLIKGINIKKYGIRAFGQYDPENGFYYNPNKLLIDPYSLELDGPIKLCESQFSGEFLSQKYQKDSSKEVPKSKITTPIIANPKLSIPWQETIIYEVHIKGFTQNNPAIESDLRGKFRALAHKNSIEYFKKLGVNCIEVLPCAAWIDEKHLQELKLTNYWGYNPICHLAPDFKYAPNGWQDIRETVAILEENGIETIIDVVFNHSGEGDKYGPIISYRGLDNINYYNFKNNHYDNSSGCGNIFACNRPHNIELFLEALRAWRKYGGVHGFRFDLANILGRDEESFKKNSPLLMAIINDSELNKLKLIAEPWDCNQYNIGEFPFEFAEWNDKFRDNMRGFWRGDRNISDFANSFCGSQNIFHHKKPSKSINYISAHDGFCLWDLVSFSNKNNFANGENNRDGTDNNLSWNNGFEGLTNDNLINSRRKKDVKILLSCLILSRGTPMISMGSECGKSQNGNNNAYAQDNEISYFDWANFDTELFDFCANIISIRKEYSCFHLDKFFDGNIANIWPDIMWHNQYGEVFSAEEWNNKNNDFLLATMEQENKRLTLVINRGDNEIDFILPPNNDNSLWEILIDCDENNTKQEYQNNRATINARNLQIFIQKPDKNEVKSNICEETLHKICDELGVSRNWHDVKGQDTIVEFQSLASIINSIGFDISSEQKARESLNLITQSNDLRPLPFHKSFDIGEPIKIEFLGQKNKNIPIILENEAGEKSLFSLRNLKQKVTNATNGMPLKKFEIELHNLNIGRYKLYFSNDIENFCSITIAPINCYFPEEFTNQKFFGLSAQIYSIVRNEDQGIGDFTTIAKLMNFAAQNGAQLLAINPLHALFQNLRDLKSPYYPSDRCFLEPLYIDLGINHKNSNPYLNYDEIWQKKHEFLFKEFQANKNNKDFNNYKKNSGQALEKFAIFESLSKHFSGLDWQNWPNEYKNIDEQALNIFKVENYEFVDYQKYLQFKCESQLENIKNEKMKIGLLRDLAIGSAPNGAEAWANQKYMAKNISIGAPPDPLGPQGQIWGLPPYNPQKLAQNHFQIYIDLFNSNMKNAGALRIDHAMGLMRQFWVPTGFKGSQGTYVKFPFKDLMAELKLASHENKCIIIAEDLGTLPHGFSEIMTKAKALSYKVLPFEKNTNGFKSMQSYPFYSFACVSTHDLPPVLGWWKAIDIIERYELGILNQDEFTKEKSSRDIEKSQLIEMLKAENLLSEEIDIKEENCPLSLIIAMHEFIALSNSFLAIAQFEDLASEILPINLPGTDKERPNWSKKINHKLEDFIQSINHGNNNAAIIRAISKNRT